MKFTAKRVELLAQTKNVLNAVPANSTIQILTGMLIEADADTGNLKLNGTNFEVAIQCKINTFVDVGGSMVVDAKMFAKMLSLLGGEDVSVVEGPNNTCSVTSGNAQYIVATQPGKHYPKPELPFPDDAVKITNVCSIVKNTIYAASKAENQHVLKGVRLEISGGNLRICGSDGNRLTESKLKIDSNGKLNLIIPAHSFGLLAGMIKDDDTLEVGIAGQNVVFTKEGLLFSARLIAGVYMDVDKMLGAIKPEYTAVVEAKEFAAAIDSVSIVTGSHSDVNVVFCENSVQLACKSDTGESKTVVNAEVSKSTPLNGFNYVNGYLYEAFRRMNGKVELQLSSIGMLLAKTETGTYFQIPMRPKQTEKVKKVKPQKEAA